MATVNQIYQLVNDAAAQAMGSTAVAVQNTAGLVSLGDTVLSSDTNKEQFYKALVDRIGRTVVAVRAYQAKKRSVKKDEMDWGAIYQKISYKKRDAVSNPTWVDNSQADPFDVAIQTEAVQTLFSKISTFSYEDSIPDAQLFTAFTNAEAMGAFISGIYTNMYNYLELAQEDLDAMAVNTNIVQTGMISGAKPLRYRNLLAEYNTAMGYDGQGDNPDPLTPAQALRNANFLKFAAREIKMTLGYLEKFGTNYSFNNIPRHTPKDKQVVEMLGAFASATETYLEADTYHNELIKLPGYEEVAFWQGQGDSSLESVSTIIQSVAGEGDTTHTVTCPYVIAFVHDTDSCASIIYKRRSHSIYNPRAERFNIFEKADQGYAVDITENSVVFTLGAINIA